MVTTMAKDNFFPFGKVVVRRMLRKYSSKALKDLIKGSRFESIGDGSSVPASAYTLSVPTVLFDAANLLKMPNGPKLEPDQIALGYTKGVMWLMEAKGYVEFVITNNYLLKGFFAKSKAPSTCPTGFFFSFPRQVAVEIARRSLPAELMIYIDPNSQ